MLEDLMEKLIEEVVTEFYKRAIEDVMIGHHFRKIQQFPGKNPLHPPIESFKEHLPKIYLFWKQQLLNTRNEDLKTTKNVFKSHQYLKMKKAELRRWVIIFNQTIDSYIIHDQQINKQFFIKWKEKISLFKEKFLQSPLIFHQE
jgi:truncated hemoglobin YjbI